MYFSKINHHTEHKNLHSVTLVYFPHHNFGRRPCSYC